jgi:MYXO-CTERM domain-containing protein
MSGQLLGIASWQYMGHIGAFWFQIDVDPSTPGVVPSLSQSGEIADASADYLAPAIAAGFDGSIGIVYVATSANQYPSMYVTGQGAGDARGTLRAPMFAGGGNAGYSCMPSNGVSPFGRYSSIAGTATGLWATAQYGGNADDCAFNTAWVNFTLPSTLVGGDDPPGGSDCCDDPVPDDPTAQGCFGCASPGDGSAPVVLLAFVVVARRRRRR